MKHIYIFTIFLCFNVFSQNKFHFKSVDGKVEIFSVDDSICCLIGSINSDHFSSLIKYKYKQNKIFFIQDSIIKNINAHSYYKIHSMYSKMSNLSIKNYCNLFNNKIFFLSKGIFDRKRLKLNRLSQYEFIVFHFDNYYQFHLYKNKHIHKKNTVIECYCGYQTSEKKYDLIYNEAGNNVTIKNGKDSLTLIHIKVIIR